MPLSEISRYVLLGHFLISYAGSVCVPLECLTCDDNNTLAVCTICQNDDLCFDDIPSICKKDFKVSVIGPNSTVEEGDDVTLTCNHDLPDLNLTYEWKNNGKELDAEFEKELELKKVLSKGRYVCSVKSVCGTYESSPHDVTVNSNFHLVFVICGVSALVLVLIMGLAMKYKMKRDAAKHKERMRQRAQDAQSGGPTPVIPRDP